jgi:hypothetical protein
MVIMHQFGILNEHIEKFKKIKKKKLMLMENKLKNMRKKRMKNHYKNKLVLFCFVIFLFPHIENKNS